MEIVSCFLSAMGAGGILLFLVQRYFKKKDEAEKEDKQKQNELMQEMQVSLKTIKLLAYARMSEEIDRLLTKGYTTPAERRILDEMYANYKAHGWNGDMDERLKKVYLLPIKDSI